MTIGILVAYLVGLAFDGIEGWRWMLGLGVVPALALAFGMLRMPQSPRWLVMTGDDFAARATLAKIRVDDPDTVDREGKRLEDIQAIFQARVECRKAAAERRTWLRSSDAHRPDPRAPSDRVFSVEFFPPKTRGGDRAAVRDGALAGASSSPTSSRSPTARGARPATARSRSRGR